MHYLDDFCTLKQPSESDSRCFGKNFPLFHNFLFSVIFFILRLAKYFFFSFHNNERQTFLCLEERIRLAVVGYFKSVFRNFALCIIALKIALFMNGLLFSRTFFYLGETCLFRTSVQTV